MLGNDMKLYRMDSLFGALPTAPIGASGANLIDKARDVTLNIEPGEADANTRGSVFTKREPALLDASIEIELLYDPDDANVAAIVNAALNRTKIALACLDGAIDDADSQGLAGNFYIFGTTRPEPLTDTVKFTATARPADDYVDYIGIGS